MSFLYSLRLGRWGIVGYSAFAFLLAALQAVGFYVVSGHTAAERAAFGQSMLQLSTQFTVLVPAPISPGTVGGYVQWRAYDFFAIVFGVWALTAASGATRGDEERGLVEQVLSTGAARADALIVRFLAFATGCAAATVAAALGVMAGVAYGHETIGLDALAGVSINLLGLTLCCYALTMLVSQLVASRLAIGASAAVLLALFLLNSLSRQLDALAAWRWLSPFRYYDLSQPLAPGGALDIRGLEVLYGSAVVLLIAAAVAFSYRDVLSPLVRLPVARPRVQRLPTRNPAWRIPVVRELYGRRVGLLLWTAGVAGIGVIFVILTKAIVQPLLELTQLRPYFEALITGGVYASFLSFIWFGFAQLLIAGYAIAEVGRWAAEDSDGRLESLLTTPTSRRGVVVERVTALLIGSLVIAAVSGYAVGIEAHAQSIGLNSNRLAAASLLLVPVAMFFAAIGGVLASVLPRATVGLLGAYAFAGYFILQLSPVFKWPDWTLNLSVFHLYGQPLSSGVDGFGLTVMLLVASVGIVATALLLERRDVGS